MRTPESDQQNQQKCSKCGKIVGCDYQGRKHKCGCISPCEHSFIDSDNDGEYGKEYCRLCGFEQDKQ